MKVQDYVIFGSNATGALAAGNNEDITWEFNLLTYYEVAQNEAVELVELGIEPDTATEFIKVRNKDNMDWIPTGFVVLGCSVASIAGTSIAVNELPYVRRPDFTKILAPVAPDSPTRASPTLKIPTGDFFRVNKVNAVTNVTTSSSHTQAVAILRKYKATDVKEQEIVQNYDSLFGGLNSNAQMWHTVGTLSQGTANVWNDLISITLLKNELYAFNKVGVFYSPTIAAGEADKLRFYIDEQIEYNRYPGPTIGGNNAGTRGDRMNFLPFNEGQYFPSATNEGQAWAVPKMYIFDKPLVVSRQYNKRLQWQIYGTAALSTETAPLYTRLCGMRYRIGL